MLSGDGAPHPENLSGQHPPHQTHRVVSLQTQTNFSLSNVKTRLCHLHLEVSHQYLVVAGNGNVDVSQRSVCVAQGDGRDVDVRGFRQRLMVSTRIGHDQEAGLSESSLNLIGEGSRSETTSEGGGAGGRGELEHSSLKDRQNHIHL